MIRALEIIGNLLDEASNEATKLPNQYTKGQLNGVKKAYQVLMKEIENPQPTQRVPQEEDIPFSTPPVNPNTGQMIKHGDQTVTVDMVRNVQQSMNQPVAQVTNNQQLNEIIRIRELLETISHRLFPTQDPSWVDQEPVASPEQNKTRRDILDNITKESQEAGLYDEPDMYPEETYEDPRKTRPWNQSFGKGLGGSNFQSNDEVVYDPETGEEGKVRTIGQRFNPDEEQTVEEWNKSIAPPPNVYVDRGGDNELEDLSPGG